MTETSAESGLEAWSDVEAASRFVAEWWASNPERAQALVDEGRLTDDLGATPLSPPGPDTSDDLAADLRAYRNESLVVIAIRDLRGRDDLETTLAALTGLAEYCCESALCEAEQYVEQRHGRLYTKTGDRQRLCIIGMGKLGGTELNFSSDIDLIFTYGDSGESDGARSLDAPAYYRRVAQRLIRTLNEPTGDGFVYRVDARLRPFGDSGALVASVAAMEHYYQAHGREWERYAWIKARPIAGDLEAGERLQAALRPFVYRRYLDYGTFESIRDMKALIERQVEQGGLQTNIKLGSGGIREIEFMVQAFQLIRGGQEPVLQNRSLLPTLAQLVAAEHIPAHQGRELDAAYRFLRRLENRLQMAADRQTHDLPSAAEPRAALATAMGYADWATCAAAIERTRDRVQTAFEQVFASPQAEDDDDEHSRSTRLADVWKNILDDAPATDVLAEFGVADTDGVLAELSGLRDMGLYRALEDRGRRWIARLIPLLFECASRSPDVDRAVMRTLSVIAAIVGRSNYIALLVEHPGALSTLVRLCQGSEWITHQIREQPALLDTLLDPRQLYRPDQGAELSAALLAELAPFDVDDLESRMNALRRFAQTAELRIAAADLTDAMPLMVVSDRLSELAEVVLGAALDMAWHQMTGRHGVPRDDVGGCAGFGVVAYGKLGGLELGYTSDLDLVFVYDGPSDSSTDGGRPLTLQVFFTRLAQRVIHILSTQTPAGRAYEIDMRLRPSGRSGLMVSHIDAFERYQDTQAWTWEHQALVRARYVAGPDALGDRFAAIRAQVLGRMRDPATLAGEVRHMRDRMRAAKDQSDKTRLDVKQMPGGLIDIEFMAQFAALRYGHDCPELLIFSDAMRILETLESAGIMDYDSIRTLTQAYRDYRRRIHAESLQHNRALIAADSLVQRRTAVAELWQHWLVDGLDY